MKILEAGALCEFSHVHAVFIQQLLPQALQAHPLKRLGIGRELLVHHLQRTRVAAGCCAFPVQQEKHSAHWIGEDYSMIRVRMRPHQNIIQCWVLVEHSHLMKQSRRALKTLFSRSPLVAFRSISGLMSLEQSFWSTTNGFVRRLARFPISDLAFSKSALERRLFWI